MQNAVGWLFGTPRCKKCLAVKKNILANSQANAIFIELDLKKPENALIFFRLAEHYGTKIPKVPALLIGGTFYGDAVEIADNLKDRNYAHTQNLIPDFLLEKNPGDEFLNSKKSLLTLPFIISAGFIDGINPCVFSTLVFLFSLLAMMKHSYLTTFLLGTLYCLAAFLTYFLMGIGILNTAKIFSSFESGIIILDSVILSALLVCAFISFRDAYSYARSRDAGKIILKLPDGLKKTINYLLKNAFSRRMSFLSVFVAGVLVTLIESACTGQVYLPILAILAKKEGMRDWLPPLLLYNMSFIMPLVIFFLFSVLGVSIWRVLDAGKKETVIAKLALAALFLILAAFQAYASFR
jgi:cytochrome c biogenesis protein CcdA